MEECKINYTISDIGYIKYTQYPIFLKLSDMNPILILIPIPIPIPIQILILILIS